MNSAYSLAEWASHLEPSAADLELAERALRDTVAVGLAANDSPVIGIAERLGTAAMWAAACHVVDFDDLHIESTTHISTVCVPVALAAGGGATAYLAGAGVMARVGSALGWGHYSRGWHATATAGALGAAAAAGVSAGLDVPGLANALALAVPAAGGVQRAFGTDAKSLQVGLAADAGVRAADLAAAGATADVTAVDLWMRLLGGDPGMVDLRGPAVPGGLAIKIYPACYGLQRPISAIRDAVHGQTFLPGEVKRIRMRTPESTVQPLIHHRPTTGLQGKFSLEYAAATALLDRRSGLHAFTDAAVARPEARALIDKVETTLSSGGVGLLDGEIEVEISTTGGTFEGRLAYPPGAPQRPPTPAEHDQKLVDCLQSSGLEPSGITWEGAAAMLRSVLSTRS